MKGWRKGRDTGGGSFWSVKVAGAWTSLRLTPPQESLLARVLSDLTDDADRLAEILPNRMDQQVLLRVEQLVRIGAKARARGKRGEVI